jgi:geranylgeranyl diphosphate synthase, type II
MPALPGFFATYQDTIERGLEALVPADGASGSGPSSPLVVREAMRYTLLAPSKRVRAVVVMLAADLCGTPSRALAAACAIEAIHASSLILDDLPSMDDAPLRRGRPAAHKAYGEAVAILAAFGLLNEAYRHLSRSYEGPLAARLTSLYTDAVGLDGLVAGQAEDVLATDQSLSFDTLERIHRRKTGVLFSAAATAGALTAGGSASDIAALTAYAKNLGLAFQIVDDLLDVIGTPEETGKAVRHDARKTTFVSFSGVDGARQLAEELCRTATSALTTFGARGSRLAELASFVAARRL